MKTCPFCAAAIEDDSFFCDQCGKELKVCFECGSFVRGKYCSGCRSTNIGFARERDAKKNQPVAPESMNKAKGKADSTGRPSAPAGGRKSASSAVQQPAGDCSLIGVEKDITMVLKSSKGSYTIGRKTGEFIEHFSDDSYISRTHASVVYDTDEQCWKLSDLGSTNGTYVNGFRLAPQMPVPLKQGDLVRFAYINFKFQ